MVIELADYTAAWRTFRRLRIAFLVLLAGWIPFMFAALWLKDRGIPSTALLVVVVLYMAAFGAIAMEWGGTRCPRCGDLFLRGNYFTFRFWSSKCSNCGVRAGSSTSPAA